MTGYHNLDCPLDPAPNPADHATVEREARDVADAAHRYAEAKSRALRDRLEAARSIGASVRAAYSLAGQG